MTTNRSIRSLTRRAALVAATVTAALVLAACGNDSNSSSGSGSSAEGHDMSSMSSAPASAEAGAHNAQDVTFAQGVIPHHQQALEMAKLAADRASSTKVKDLASRVEKAQDPEIRTMSGWLKTWGENLPSEMPGMDHSMGSGMTGMMSTKDMTQLEKSSGKEFDTMFLTMMVEHHKGAVEMATTEKGKGKYSPATKMADGIITAQNAEIDEMNKLLGKN